MSPEPVLHLDALGVVLPPDQSVVTMLPETGVASVRDAENPVSLADEDRPSDMAARALQSALAEAHLDASSLDLVLGIGVSPNSPPSWSMAAQVMRQVGVSPACLGFDLAIGCMGMLVGIQTALAQLALRGGGRAAVVTAERWSATVAPSNHDKRWLWGYSDGGAALVVSCGNAASTRPFARFHGAEFANHAGSMLIRSSYEREVGRVITALRRRCPEPIRRVICNQVSPRLVAMLESVAEVPAGQAVVSDHDYCHVGAADLVLGLRRLIEMNQFDGPTLVAASVPFAFGAGLITPRAR